VVTGHSETTRISDKSILLQQCSEVAPGNRFREADIVSFVLQLISVIIINIKK
jgi:hypothetical protein